MVIFLTGQVMGTDDVSVEDAAADAETSEFFTHTTTYKASKTAYDLIETLTESILAEFAKLKWAIKHDTMLQLMEKAPFDADIRWDPVEGKPDKLSFLVENTMIKRCAKANVEVYKAYRAVRCRSAALKALANPSKFAGDESDASALHTHWETVYSPSNLGKHAAELRKAFMCLAAKLEAT